jgi:transposase
MNVVGFDVGKDSLFGARIDASMQVKEHFEVSNTSEAITEVLIGLQQRYKRLLVASESTSEYHYALAHCCLDLGIPFRLLNPITTKQFVRATVRKKKTDPSDAWVIAKLAQQGEGTPVTAGLFNEVKPILRTSTKLAELGDIVNRIDKRLSGLLPAERELHEQLVTCRFQLTMAVTVFRERAIEASPKDLTKLLVTIPGIGVTIAPTLIAEIGDITRFRNPKSLVAYAGLDPRVRQSGYSLQRNTRLTKRGSPFLRRALYIAATIAQRWEPQYITTFDKKKAEGRRYKEATIVNARKILKLCICCLDDKHTLQTSKSLT